MLVLAAGVAGCGGRAAEAEPARAPTAAPRPVVLFCEDCAAAGMEINLWDAPNGRVVARVPHNTPALELERRTVGDARFVRVRTDDGKTGWLAALLVRLR